MINKLKKYKIIISIILCLVIIVTIGFFIFRKITNDNFYKKMLNIKLPKNSTVLIEKNRHSGFHGDGEYYAEIQLTKDGAKTFIDNINKTDKWHSLPLPIDFAIIVYGGNLNGINYDIGNFSKNIPKNIKNGLYYVKDRYAETYPTEKNTNINSRFSYNVTVSIFDVDKNKLYIYTLDT